jgi:hypothetical protein
MITIVVEVDAVVLPDRGDHASAADFARRVEAQLSQALNRGIEAAAPEGGSSLDQTAAIVARAIARALPAPEL